MKIVTLSTCHNRRERTLRALEGLHSQELPQDVELIHVLVDDGSNDGTSSAVAERLPDVELIRGTGQLYWAGGMLCGWEQSVRHKQFDFLFVYNDDVEFFPDAFKRLIDVGRVYEKNHDAVPYVVIGSCQSSIDRSTTYGGQVRNSRINPLSFTRIDPPMEGYLFVDTLNMNCALIHRDALALTNFLARYFKHGGADFEFGIRLKKKGGSVLLASGYFGFCERNPENSATFTSLSDYLKKRASAKRAPPLALFNFYKSHGGILWPYFLLRHYVTKSSVMLFLTGKWF